MEDLKIFKESWTSQDLDVNLQDSLNFLKSYIIFEIF